MFAESVCYPIFDICTAGKYQLCKYQISNVQTSANFVGEVGRCQFSRPLRLCCEESSCSVMT